jgi:hypothetical protein
LFYFSIRLRSVDYRNPPLCVVSFHGDLGRNCVTSESDV